MFERDKKKKVYPFAHCVGQEGYTLIYDFKMG